MTRRGRNHMRTTCPHCDSFARIRTSQHVTPTITEALVECTNVDCGWRGKMTMSIDYTYTPSFRPNAAIRIPLSPRMARRLADNATD